MRKFSLVLLAILLLLSLPGCWSEKERQDTLLAEAALTRAQTEQIQASMAAQEAAHRQFVETATLALLLCAIVSIMVLAVFYVEAERQKRQGVVYYILPPVASWPSTLPGQAEQTTLTSGGLKIVKREEIKP